MVLIFLFSKDVGWPQAGVGALASWSRAASAGVRLLQLGQRAGRLRVAVVAIGAVLTVAMFVAPRLRRREEKAAPLFDEWNRLSLGGLRVLTDVWHARLATLDGLLFALVVAGGNRPASALPMVWIWDSSVVRVGRGDE